MSQSPLHLRFDNAYTIISSKMEIRYVVLESKQIETTEARAKANFESNYYYNPFFDYCIFCARPFNVCTYPDWKKGINLFRITGDKYNTFHFCVDCFVIFFDENSTSEIALCGKLQNSTYRYEHKKIKNVDLSSLSDYSCFLCDQEVENDRTRQRYDWHLVDGQVYVRHSIDAIAPRQVYSHREDKYILPPSMCSTDLEYQMRSYLGNS